jgi:hypothetical protein
MRTNWLITTAVAAILASTGLAAAQGMNERGGQSPGAMDKGAPSGQQMQRDKAGTAGQGQQRTGVDDQKQPRGAQKDDQKQPRGAQKDDQKQPRGAQKDDQKQPRGAQRDDDRQQRGRAQQQQQQKQDRQGAETKGRAETTGRGDAAGGKLTSEQRTRIREVVVSKNIPRVTNVNFNVSVGTVVPRTVTFHPIPVEIVEIYPAWRGYRVILIGSQLVIVHPSSYRIIAVIPV